MKQPIMFDGKIQLLLLKIVIPKYHKYERIEDLLSLKDPFEVGTTEARVVML
jgi:hypothetical protein